MAVLILCGVLAALIVAFVVACVLRDLVGHLSDGVRLSMLALAAGLIWGGVDRFHRAPVGLGDALFLGGVLGLLVFAWWERLSPHLDRLDGRQDGHLTVFRKG